MSTSLNSHPLYQYWYDEWIKLNHSYEGERKIKEEGLLYLPATSGMRIDGMGPGDLGFQDYCSYRMRAVYPDDFAESIRNYLGLLHQKPPVISLPFAMQGMLTNCTSKGEDMANLVRRINELQLKHGRLGIMLDLPEGETRGTLPYVSVYDALTVINWDESGPGGRDNLNMVVLDESGSIRVDGFSWKDEKKFRYLILGQIQVDEGVGTSVYRQGVKDVDTGITEEELVTVSYMGTPLPKIPFEFINTVDITSTPDVPPLLGLANVCLTIYRGEADYRQTLYLQSQETLVIVGGVSSGQDNAPRRVGAGAVIDVNVGGDAKYIGIGAEGLAEQRTSLENDRAEAILKSGQLISTTQSSQESGEAMKTRIAARTANLVRIAFTGCAALERLLRSCAEWMGANPDEVSVKPNLEFAKNLVDAQGLIQIMTARNTGAPISLESIHSWLVDQGLTDKTFEEEMAMVGEEVKKWPLPQDANSDMNTNQQTQKVQSTLK